MRCSENSERMSLYLDGLLGREQTLHLQTHLSHCEACHEEWEAMYRLSTLLKAAPAATPAPGFTARVARRLQQRNVHRRRLYSSIGVCLGSIGLWALAGIASLLLFLVFWQPLICIVLFDAGLSLVNNVLSVLAVLGKALCSITYALALRPGWLLLLGYATLALGVIILWMHIVLQRWGHVPE